MRRYFFNILSPNRTITDNTGKKLSGLEAAHWRAVNLAYQVRVHLPDDVVYPNSRRHTLHKGNLRAVLRGSRSGAAEC
jgi:hypothetical protein